MGVVYYELLKSTEIISEDPYRLHLMCLSWVLIKKWPLYKQRLTKWFCNMTILGHMLQNWWKPTWKCLNGKSYPNQCIHLTLPQPTVTCSDQWHLAWLSSTFILMKIPKNGLICGEPQKTYFSNVEFKCCQKHWKK